MALGEPLHAAWRVELTPFGAQGRNGVALFPDLAAQLADTFGLQGGVEFDLVDEGCRYDQRRNDHDVEETHGSQRPFSTSASAGTRGNRSDRSAR